MNFKQQKPKTMTLEDAKRVSDILQKIDRNKEIINNLKFKKTHDIKFGRINESSFIILDKELIDTIVDHSLHVLTEEIWELEQELKLL
jgi:hypothetical protein